MSKRWGGCYRRKQPRGRTPASPPRQELASLASPPRCYTQHLTRRAWEEASTWAPGTPSFKDWGDAATDPRDGFYTRGRDADDESGSPIKSVAPAFAGRTWVLVGAGNSSATFELASTLKQNRLGTLVGEPTGGNQRGINGGAFFFRRLPNSGIELDIGRAGAPALD